MTALTGTRTAHRQAATEPGRRRKPLRPARVVLYVFLTAVALGWLAPLLLAVYASLRPYQETATFGYLSWPRHLSFDYYVKAWSGAEMGKYFRNTLYIAVPSVLAVLFLASFVGFALARFTIPLRKTLLVLFT